MEPGSARMDFEFERMNGDLVDAIEATVNAELARGREIRVNVLPRAEAFAIPDLIRTKVNLLPPGIAEIRTVEIVGLDLQADGGTHVANTSEVGRIAGILHVRLQPTRSAAARAHLAPRAQDPHEGTARHMFDRLLGLFSRDIGIDLGTANTLVHVRNRGIVISEPSVVAIEAKTKKVLAIGAEAKRMVGRTPASIIAVRPLRDGVISDFDVTEQMIKYFVNRVHDRVGLIPRPRMLLGVPSGVTEVEKRAVRDAALNAGARWARLIEEPMAAAIGAGLPVSEPSGSLIVDIGGGTTEVAVISLGGIVVARSIRIGGDEMDQDIVTFARREYNLFLGERTAEDIKIAIASAYPGEWDAQRVALRGRDLLTGLPRSVEVGRRPDPRGDRAVRPADRRHDQGHDRGDAARAGRRHHGPGHRPGRRWAPCWPASTSGSRRPPRCPSTSPTIR